MTDENHATGRDAGVTIQVAPADSDDGGGLPDLARIAAIVVGIGFSIGLLYNVGFFLEIDPRLFPLLTYKDHLETLVIFTPLAIVPIVGSLVLRVRPARRRLASTTAVALAAAAMGAWLGRDQIVGSPGLSAFVVDVVAVTAFLLVAYCTAVIVDRGLKINDTQADSAGDQALLAISFSLVGVLVFVTLLGAAQAHIAMRPGGFDTQITLAGEGQATQVKPAHLVRVIDTGLLVLFRDAPNQLSYVRNESVRSLSEPVNP